MSPLSVEVYNEAKRMWTKAGEVKPEDPPGSISDNKPDGTREIYIFKCAEDDSQSTIYRSKAGADMDIGKLRKVVPFEGLIVVKKLRKGEFYKMQVRTDVSPRPRKIRVSHK